LICICNLFAFGQSKQETIDFIISEFKSIENNTYVFKDVTFSQGELFSLSGATAPENQTKRLSLT